MHGRDGRSASFRRFQHERHGLEGRWPGLPATVYASEERGGEAGFGAVANWDLITPASAKTVPQEQRSPEGLFFGLVNFQLQMMKSEFGSRNRQAVLIES